MSQTILAVRQLEKSWLRSGLEPLKVLTQLSLTVVEGESVAILGPSGSGKSTLLSLLAGLDRPTAGSIEVMGSDMATMDEARLTAFRGKNLGIVFQQFHLMPTLTAIENVTLPLEIMGAARARERASEALQKVGLAHRMEHLPKELSGGESQRVAIARALVVRPALLLADEPSGNLDPDTGAQVTDVLFEQAAKNNMTMIVVTHNADLAKRCTRQLVMQHGRLL